jgi:hypothetical protein
LLFGGNYFPNLICDFWPGFLSHNLGFLGGGRGVKMIKNKGQK